MSQIVRIWGDFKSRNEHEAPKPFDLNILIDDEDFDAISTRQNNNKGEPCSEQDRYHFRQSYLKHKILKIGESPKQMFQLAFPTVKDIESYYHELMPEGTPYYASDDFQEKVATPALPMKSAAERAESKKAKAKSKPGRKPKATQAPEPEPAPESTDTFDNEE